MKKHTPIGITLSILASALTANAVIVGGTSGAPSTGFHKSEQALSSTLESLNLPQFNNWQSLVSYSGASGVIIGVNTAGEVLVATANHVGAQQSLTWQSQGMTRSGSSFSPEGRDIRIDHFTPNETLLIAPPTLTLQEGTPMTGDTLLGFGFGNVRADEELADGQTHYNTMPNPGGVTWGINEVSSVGQSSIYTNFDKSSPFDYQFTPGDSGGPLFAYNPIKEEWLLSGIGVAVIPNILTQYIPVGTGTLFSQQQLVPEPGTAILAFLTTALFALRRNRD